MAGKRKTMEQIRNILRQKINGSPIRAIVRHTRVSRNTIKGYIRMIEANGYSLPKALELDDEALMGLLYEPNRPPCVETRHTHFQEKLPLYAIELKKRHVTRQLLWEEYRQEFADGYGYTRFCHHLNEYIGKKDVTAIFSHCPGEKLMVDFAGDKLSYIDKESGEIIDCEVLITALPFIVRAVKSLTDTAPWKTEEDAIRHSRDIISLFESSLTITKQELSKFDEQNKKYSHNQLEQKSS